ncbi:MAG TPA: zinc-binding dehydrogenase [Polyangiaceae bacterium]|nr:zinc-binding dehydrogenase [Polyangiaceae bacterium]
MTNTNVTGTVKPSRSMKAAYVERLGGLEEICIGELPVPELAADDVLVRVEAVAVDPVDALIRSGRYRTPLPAFPFVIGRDLVGEVVGAGPAATGRFATGTRVWSNSLGYAGRQGPTAEYAAVPVERLYAVPDGVEATRMAALVHPAATAHVGLVRHAGGVRPGDVVVVGGAAGNVGTCVSELAVAQGAAVVALARPEDAEWCRRHGASAVVDYAAPDLRAALQAAVFRLSPAGAQVWFDTSGRIDFELAVETLGERATIVLVAAAPAPPPFPVLRFFQKSLRVSGFVITTASLEELAAAARSINALVAAGRLDLRVEHVLSLDQAAEAHRLVEQGVRGRVVMRVSS